MPAQRTTRQIQITIPDALYQWLSSEARRREQDIPTIVQAALEDYARQFDLTQTRTWQMCGSLSVSEPESQYVVGADGTGAPLTNYAEHSVFF